MNVAHHQIHPQCLLLRRCSPRTLFLLHETKSLWVYIIKDPGWERATFNQHIWVLSPSEPEGFPWSARPRLKWWVVWLSSGKCKRKPFAPVFLAAFLESLRTFSAGDGLTAEVVTDIGVWKSQVWLPSQVATLEGHLDYCLVMSWRNCMWFYRPVSLVSNTVYRWSLQCCPDLYFFLSVVMPETRRETKLMLIEISICGRDLAHSPVVSFSLHNNPAR